MELLYAMFTHFSPLINLKIEHIEGTNKKALKVQCQPNV